MIPLRWWIIDRCAFRGELGTLEGISGETVCVWLDDGRLLFGSIDELDLAPFHRGRR